MALTRSTKLQRFAQSTLVLSLVFIFSSCATFGLSPAFAPVSAVASATDPLAASPASELACRPEKVHLGHKARLLTLSLGGGLASTPMHLAKLSLQYEKASRTRFTGPPALGEQAAGYTGHATDVESNLVYARARYYDPSLGRFLSEDPVFGDLSNPASTNYFAYANGNPLSYTDPDGEFAWFVLPLALGGAYIAAGGVAALGTYIGINSAAAMETDETRANAIREDGYAALAKAETVVAVTGATQAGAEFVGAGLGAAYMRYSSAGKMATAVAKLEAGTASGVALAGRSGAVGEIAEHAGPTKEAARALEAGASFDEALSAPLKNVSGSLDETGYLARGMNFGRKNGRSGTASGAPEPEVQEFIRRFEKKYPGRSFSSGHKKTTADGKQIEIDFETSNAIVEIKGNKGKGLAAQIRVRSQPAINPDGKVCIGIACHRRGMSRHVKKGITREGGLGASGDEMDVVIDVIAP